MFGSLARGEDDEDSDVDLLVDISTSARGFAYFGVLEELRRALEELLGHRVDVVELRGPFSSRAQRVADRIRSEAIPL